jgi:flavin reductase (DIM6/NTAB) family NADH-FMN oxidoreductase RutF
MECKLVDIVSVSKQPLGGSLVLGEVLRFHVADELFQDYRIDPDRLQAIGRMGGPTYSRTKDRFDLERPKL